MIKICLDPGHGGSDPGAVGSSGLEEAAVNLLVCTEICQQLEKLGIQTESTRTTNVYVALMTRCDIANDWGADYFVSVHCNSNGPSAVGIETLYKTAKGEQLAKPIQSALIDATGDTDRGLKYRSDLYVLNGTVMPAVLVEIGFISNPDTESLLKLKTYQSLVAEAIVRGIGNFLKLKLPSP